MRPIFYLFGYIFPILAGFTLFFKGWTLLTLPVVAFVLIPILEFVMIGTTENVAENMSDTQKTSNTTLYDWLIYGLVPLHISVMFTLMYLSSIGHFLNLFEMACAIFTVGICCGTFGINIAHELGHRSKPHEQFMSKILLLSSLYLHFFIEHNKGHHARVATEEDPASSRKGENVYGFWFRSVTQSYFSAWEIESKRLEKKFKKQNRTTKNTYLTFENQMLRFQITQLIAFVLVFLIAGPIALAMYIGAGTIGFLLLETVNYIEHYGLCRDKKENGKYERVQPHHSWNSNHSVGRALLFELTRHSDHHAYPGRKYPVLRHFDNSPQFPAGYPSMILLSLLPPLWFRIMDKHLESELQRLEKLAA